MGKKIILLKLTGTIFSTYEKKSTDNPIARSILSQIKQLSSTYQFGIVIGGGNFFRGSEQSAELGITASIAHHVGMLATIMNGLILKDLCDQLDIPARLLSALTIPAIAESASPHAIASALKQNHLLIFSGGTGNPFFTTDTCSVLRALEIGADELWKGTYVEGICDKDPRKNKDATVLHSISYKEALDQKLCVMDLTAFTLAEKHKLPIRIFNIFCENALVNAARDKNFGSIIS